MEEFKPWGMEEKSFLLLMHLSQFSGIVIPGAGLFLPIVMWVTKGDQSENIDEHGKVIINWTISLIIYSIVSFVLVFVVIGIFSFIALMIMNLIFVIVGAVKAKKGELWRYPLSIKFL